MTSRFHRGLCKRSPLDIEHMFVLYYRTNERIRVLSSLFDLDAGCGPSRLGLRSEQTRAWEKWHE